MAGLHAECVPWLHARGIAVLGSDVVSDADSGAGDRGLGHADAPVHPRRDGRAPARQSAPRLAEAACAELSQWDFQLTVAPLRIERGTGSPVNPIALL